MDYVKKELLTTPMLFPYEPGMFWDKLRQIVREEISALPNKRADVESFSIEGLTHKPLYKINELCHLFHISRTTIYDWVRHGKLKPYKIRSRVYFLFNDIQALLNNADFVPKKAAAQM